MARVLKPQVRGTLVYSTESDNQRVNRILGQNRIQGEHLMRPEIESENWEHNQVERGGNFASDRRHEEISRIMQGNRAAGL